jgi:hypothetical protein
MKQRPIKINATVTDKKPWRCRCKRLSSPSIVRHILAASWKDSKSPYPENEGNAFLRNVGSSYENNTVSYPRNQNPKLLLPWRIIPHGNILRTDIVDCLDYYLGLPIVRVRQICLPVHIPSVFKQVTFSISTIIQVPRLIIRQFLNTVLGLFQSKLVNFPVLPVPTDWNQFA